MKQMEGPNPYRIWDMLLLICITLAAIEIPAQLVLGYMDHPVAVYFDHLITLFFLANILFTLRPIMIEGKVLTISRGGARRYLTH